MGENKPSVKERLGLAVYKYRGPVLAAVLIICAVFMVFLKDVKLDEDPMATMYPDSHPFLKGLTAIEKMAPRTNMLVCLLETKNSDIYNAPTIKKIDEITKGLMDCEVINTTSVTSLTKGMDNYEYTANGLNIVPVMGNVWPETPDQFLALKRRVATNPMGSGKYVSYDGKAVMITATLSSPEQVAQSSWQQMDDKQKAGLVFEKYKSRVEGEFDPKLMKKLLELKKKVNDKNHELLFMGEEVIKADMTRMGMTQMPVAGGVMFILMIALVSLYFRSWQAVVISIIAMIFPAGAGLGLYSLLGKSINPMAVLFPLTVAITSVAASVMVLDGYYRALAAGCDKSSAVLRAWGNVPAGLAIASIVSLSLLAAKVSMLRELGILGAISLAIALATGCLAVPALASILPVPKKPPRSWGGIASALAPSGKFKNIAIAVFIGLIAFGCFAIDKIKPGDNIPGSSYLWCSNQWNRCFNLFTSKFMGPNQLLVYVKANKVGGLTEPEALEDISAFSNYLKYSCGAKDSIAFDFMVQMARYTMSDGSPKWQNLPETAREGKGLGGMVTENSDVKEFIDPTYTQATISPFFPFRNSESINEYAKLMQEYIDKHPSKNVEFSLGGGLLGMSKLINDGITGSFLPIMITVSIVILVLSIVFLRSFKAGVLSGLFAVTGVMAVIIKLVNLGMPLSMPFLIVMAAGAGAAAIMAVQASNNRSRGSVLFASVLVLFMCLPWGFIGMRFQALMVMGFAAIAVSGGIFALVFYLAFSNRNSTNECTSVEEVNRQ
jgi:predicted RND superfamily exporter protein